MRNFHPGYRDRKELERSYRRIFNPSTEFSLVNRRRIAGLVEAIRSHAVSYSCYNYVLSLSSQVKSIFILTHTSVIYRKLIIGKLNDTEYTCRFIVIEINNKSQNN